MTTNNLGVHPDGKSHVFIVRGGSAEENVREAMARIGGIDKYIDLQDIVVLKPNAQWWNQGTTNTNSMKGFIELVLGIPGFEGEIIIAENHHYKEPNSRGWTASERNGDFNLNELVEYFQQKGHENVTKYHWCDGGVNPHPRQGDAGGNGVVRSVEDGDGYVWLQDTVYVSAEDRRCMMTYPVFTSAFSGKRIDLKKGVYQDGKFHDNLKLINFSCLNHHSDEFGVTASVKNLMGIVDMTCGYQGAGPEDYFNTHYIGSESPLYKLGVQLRYWGDKYGFGPKPGSTAKAMGVFNSHYTGGALGFWMKRVKMPDLHILAAELVGWGGRLDTEKRARIKTVALSEDPVALDYIGTKRLLLPATPKESTYYRDLNNPDKAPFRLFLQECHHQGIGNLSEKGILVEETTL
jgi:hypothetical protein